MCTFFFSETGLSTSVWSISALFNLFENEASFHGWWVALAPRYCGSHLKFVLKRPTLLSSLLRTNPWVQKYSVPKICHQKCSSDNTSCKYSSFLFLACAVQLHLLHFASAAERGTTLGLCQGSIQLKKDKAFEHSSNWLKSRLLWCHTSHPLSYIGSSAAAARAWWVR